MFGLVGGMGIASGAALYFMQPETLPRQICVVAASSALAWGVAKIVYLWSMNPNEPVLARIRELKKDHEVNLFVGRRAAEALPEIEGKEVWVSVDIVSDPGYIKDHPDRLHLVMNVSDIASMQTIEGLFNKVVVDLSVSKFFENSALMNLRNAIAPGGSLMIPDLLPSKRMVFSYMDAIPEIDYFVTQILFAEVEKYDKQVWDFAAKKLGYQLELEDSAAATRFFEANEEHIERIPGFEDSEGLWRLELETYQKYFCFFKHLAKKEQNIKDIYETKRIKCIDKIKQDLSQGFDQVNIYHNKFPYPNGYDQKGKKLTTYLHAEGRHP